MIKPSLRGSIPSKAEAISEIASLTRPPQFLAGKFARNDVKAQRSGMTVTHQVWMRCSLACAEQGRGLTHPNPMVGACLVKNGKLIAEGFHRFFGGPHAEVEAIRKAGKRARGATLYVTLEPCSTYGKTPPCTEAIKTAGIKRVVVAAVDPNPKHQGRGLGILKRCGIRVETGILRREAELQNEAFLKWVKTKLPFVTLKMAQSLDGKIASRTGKSRWVSNVQSRNWVHRLRAQQDAILVGKNTLLKDNPRLTVRNGKLTKTPWRIVLDERGESSPSAHIFHASGVSVLACSRKFLSRVSKKFSRSKVTLMALDSSKGEVDLNQLLRALGALGIVSLLVEGGGEVAWSFFNAGLVDKIEWILAPKIIGGRTAKTSVEGVGINALDEASKIRPTRLTLLGDHLLLEGYVRS
ncbi:MAG: bifunctional diaminohydroxyphosphoribosylaminopyrimidine deaminase/5-amino-6-(5-phosphoribosylamino)uracil reductase RibD [Candidatus Omnitrophica bacterium]|nr:bifunctional diaminohydroxyphosphoribosylaminopyrimidine deaminase/5-amino-6-(5-phosphoribosylamino)uracil reductase RibD [Candidatus Omnitrophota bacterium]